MLLVAAAGVSVEAGPLDNLFVATKVEADPNKDYQLTKENGPWLVMACTFSGENAYEQARDLALELRREYKVPAYLYSKTFEHEVGDSGRGIDRFGEPLSLKYMKGDETTEIAVLVGDFPTLDNDQAQKTLNRIKNASPECLRLDPNRPTARNLASWRLFFGMAHDANEKKGPMWKAFLVANPLLPKEYFAPSGLEKFIVDLNQDRPYSLLKCPGKYTVQVAHFTGRVEIDPKKVRAVMNGEDFGSKLEEAGEKAERLTKLLREKEYEAYVFHDRNASIVTVGSFESVGTPRPDGRIEIHPEIHRIMKVFGAENTPQGGTIRKDLGKIPFDMQPIPVEVPRASISASYASRGWGLN
jgi:hypothetical protein